MKCNPIIPTIFLTISLATWASAQTTAPAQDAATAAQDPPAPAAMAPTYLSIGKDLCLRLALVRRTLDDLTLDPAIRQQANQIVESADADLKHLMSQIESGRMPGMHRLMSVPDNLRAAREKLINVIGPRQGDILEEKLRSIRGEARGQIAWLQQQIADLKLPTSAQSSCGDILKSCRSAAEKLPDTDVQGDEYAAARAKMNQLFISAHNELSQLLNGPELTRLGERFAAMGNPATRPSGS